MKAKIIIAIVFCIVFFFIIGIIAFYPSLYFWTHFECEFDKSYEAYALVNVKSWGDETLVLPETMPNGEPIKLLRSVIYEGENDRIKEIVIPDTYEKAFEGALSGLSSLDTLHIGKNLETPYVFVGYSTLEKITVDPNNENYISEGNCVIDKRTNTVVVGCKNSIIPDWVEIIGDAAFARVEAETIEIPKSVKKIGPSAFVRSSIKTLELGENIETIHYTAFRKCNLLTVYCDMEKLPQGWEDGCFEDVLAVKMKKTGDGSLS